MKNIGENNFFLFLKRNLFSLASLLYWYLIYFNHLTSEWRGSPLFIYKQVKFSYKKCFLAKQTSLKSVNSFPHVVFLLVRGKFFGITNRFSCIHLHTNVVWSHRLLNHTAVQILYVPLEVYNDVSSYLDLPHFTRAIWKWKMLLTFLEIMRWAWSVRNWLF